MIFKKGMLKLILRGVEPLKEVDGQGNKRRVDGLRETWCPYCVLPNNKL